MENAKEFYSACNANKAAAIELAAGNEQLIERIKSRNLPDAKFFQIEDGFLPAPGFTAEAILASAKSDIQHDTAMNRMQKEIDSNFDND